MSDQLTAEEIAEIRQRFATRGASGWSTVERLLAHIDALETDCGEWRLILESTENHARRLQATCQQYRAQLEVRDMDVAHLSHDLNLERSTCQRYRKALEMIGAGATRSVRIAREALSGGGGDAE
jgi:hypothetical protein